MVNEIQQGGYNGLLHKLLGMKEGAPAPVLGAEVLPALVLESQRPEWEFLKGHRLGIAGGVMSIAVGELSSLTITNPENSGTLIILEDVYLGQIIAAQVAMQLVTIPLGGAAPITTFSKGVRDSRGAGATGTPFANLTAVIQDTRAAVSRVTAATGVIGGGDQSAGIYKLDWIIAPGFAVIFEQLVANAAFSNTLLWRERNLEPSETR